MEYVRMHNFRTGWHSYPAVQPEDGGAAYAVYKLYDGPVFDGYVYQDVAGKSHYTSREAYERYLVLRHAAEAEESARRNREDMERREAQLRAFREREAQRRQ